MTRPATASTDPTRFEHPLAARYASAEMLALWSAQHRVGVWRRIWIALAECQRDLGLPISDQQIAALRAAADRIDFEAAARYERELRHDVMAHIHAFGDAAPAARGVIHLGATSMDIVDNADLMLMRAALDLLVGRLAAAAAALAAFCERYAELPALGYTHLQPAQLTTVGKRGTLWLQDLITDIQRLHELRRGLKCRGLRGATGTQASFLKLLGSPQRVQELEQRFAQKLGFQSCYDVSGQTYSRKVDVEVVGGLASLAASAHKLCNDVRILAMLKEVEEPVESAQVGSSAMPYKRNPARSERATGIARYLISLHQNPLMTLAEQMLERTLDDSSNKRIVIPEAFLAADALALLLHNICDGLVVYPAIIAARVAAELPFIATENIIMAAVAAGGDRQELHEHIRVHSQAAGAVVKQQSGANDLIARLRMEPILSNVNMEALLNPVDYIGLAPQQTRAYVTSARRILLELAINPVEAAPLRV